MTVRALLLGGILLASSFSGGAGCVTAGPRPDRPPDHPLLVEAESRYLAGDRDGALAKYRGYRTGFGPSPHTSDAWYWEGVILLEKGEAAGAERAFAECARSPRTTFLASMAEAGIGDACFVADRFADAIAAYQRALDARCRDARTDYILYRLAVAYQRSGEWSRGRSCYGVLIRDHPRSPFAARARQRLEYPDQAYHVQVGAFQDEAAAKHARGVVLSKGIAAKVVRAPEGAGEAPFLVWAGHFTRYEDARGALPEIARIAAPREATLVP